MLINRVASRSIFDTRQRSTVETTLTSGLVSVTASVPSGKSTGTREAIELRDADGSVTQAVTNVNEDIARAITGRDFSSPDELDALLIALDGTPNKSRLGANAILSVSIAAMRLFAEIEGVPLWRAISTRAGTTPRAPRLYINVMNGGAHVYPAVASAKEDGFPLPFQEYLLVIEGNMGTAFPIAQEAFAKVGERLGNPPTGGMLMGDEGGYAPTFATLEEPIHLLASVVEEFPGTAMAIDAAASELFRDGKYHLIDRDYSPEQLSSIYEDLAARYPLRSIEDPFAENASDDFVRLTEAMGKKVIIIGDDLTVTNPARIREAATRKEITGVLIKPNQIGTVREAIQAVQETYAAGFEAVASHRSGETHDTFIADFAYGVGAYGIKAGGLGQTERVEKYSRLRAIEREAEAV